MFLYNEIRTNVWQKEGIYEIYGFYRNGKGTKRIFSTVEKVKVRGVPCIKYKKGAKRVMSPSVNSTIDYVVNYSYQNKRPIRIIYEKGMDISIRRIKVLDITQERVQGYCYEKKGVRSFTRDHILAASMAEVYVENDERDYGDDNGGLYV